MVLCFPRPVQINSAEGKRRRKELLPSSGNAESQAELVATTTQGYGSRQSRLKETSSTAPEVTGKTGSTTALRVPGEMCAKEPPPPLKCIMSDT